ncbi:MAG: hypothetical protein JW801_11340 [Bacteroidales bacterium]|nr:hypothetical protein [Bacteroidales bacterium]
MKNIIYIALLIIFGCSVHKKVAFKTETFASAGKELKYAMLVPRGYIKCVSNMDNYILKEFSYPDSAILYISLDFNFANSPNHKNWIKCLKSEGIKCEEGIQENNKYWREILVKDLVLGYYNVNKSQKEEFDKAIESLKLKSTLN